MRIQQKFPDEPLHLVCRHGFGSFFEKAGLVQKAFEVQKGEGRSPYKELVTHLRKTEYDKVWCPHQSVRTALVMRQIRARERVGFYTSWNVWAFEKRVRREMSWPDALRQLSLLSHHDSVLAEELSQLSGIENPSSQQPWQSRESGEIPDWCSMSLLAKGKMSQDAVSLLDRTRRKILEDHKLIDREFAILAPGSVWPTKRWTVEGYSKVAEDLIKKGWSVVLTGSPGEVDICGSVARQTSGVVDLAGKTSLFETFALMSAGRILISNDSGAAHLASCAELPTIALFGPTTLSLGYRPWQNQAVVMQKELPCRPCGKHGAMKCPIGTHECMTTITADEVLAYLRLLTL